MNFRITSSFLLLHGCITCHDHQCHPKRGELHQAAHPVTFSGVNSPKYTLVGLGDSNCMPVRLAWGLGREAWVVRRSRVLAEAAHDPVVAEILR